MKGLTGFFLLLFLSVQVFGQGVVSISKTEHQVEQGETMSSICRRYNISLDALMKKNNKINYDIRIGEVLYIPTEQEARTLGLTTVRPIPEPDEGNVYAGRIPRTYLVSFKESLSVLAARLYLNIDSLALWNDLSTNSLIYPNTVLIIGHEKRTSENAVALVSEQAAHVPKGSYVNPEMGGEPSVHDKTVAEMSIEEAKEHNIPLVKVEKGKGVVVNSPTTKSIALHYLAKQGELMKVVNPVNGKYVFVKVIGKLPESERKKGVIIKMSKPACDKIGISGDEFFVELKYKM